MRFDEAFDILVEHCARVSAGLAAAAGQRVSTYGNDDRRYSQKLLGPTQSRSRNTYPAALSALRPGPHASDDG